MNLPNFSLKNLFLPQCNYFSPLTSKSLIIVLDLSINVMDLIINAIDLTIIGADLTLQSGSQHFIQYLATF